MDKVLLILRNCTVLAIGVSLVLAFTITPVWAFIGWLKRDGVESLWYSIPFCGITLLMIYRLIWRGIIEEFRRKQQPKAERGDRD